MTASTLPEVNALAVLVGLVAVVGAMLEWL